MARLRANNALGLLGSALTAAGTTIDFGASAPAFPTVAAPDYIPLVLEPPSTPAPSTKFEIVYLTAYTAGQTTGTILRGREGTTGVTHSSGAVWVCGPTALDASPWVLYEPVAVAAPATRASSAYGYLTDGGDVVPNVVINGPSTLLHVFYEALWVPDSSNPANGRAAIFVGGNQLQYVPLNGAAVVQEADGFGTNGYYVPLGTADAGLYSNNNANPTGNSGDPPAGPYVIPVPVPNNQPPLGMTGWCIVRGVPAGTVDVGVQFKGTDAGTQYVKDRRLIVATMG